MVGVHTEYIPQTRNFVRVRADSTKSAIFKSGIEYGPYSLKKKSAAKQIRATTSEAGKRKGAPKEIAEQKDAGSDSATTDGTTDDTKKFDFEHNGTRYSFTQVEFNKEAELRWKRILTKRKHTKPDIMKGAFDDCKSFLSFLQAAEKKDLPVEKYECGDGVSLDQIRKVLKQRKAAAKFGELGDSGASTVPARSRQAAASVPVSFDFWFYTGDSTDAIEIKQLAEEEGVFEPGEHDAKVMGTTTTIKRSTLCISSLLSTHTDESEHLSLIAPGEASAETDAETDKHSKLHFGGTIPVDFSGFELAKTRCLITYIAGQGPQSAHEAEGAAEEEDEAVDEHGKDDPPHTEADGQKEKDAATEEDEDDEEDADTAATEHKKSPKAAKPDADEDASSSPSTSASSESPSTSDSSLVPVYIFYTVEAQAGSEGPKVHSDDSKKKIPGDQTKESNKEYNNFKKGASYWLRLYVPSVLAERVVLDAMMDLVTRCVDTTQGYDVATRAIQTIMLSDVEYHVVADGSAPELVSMEPEKPAKPVPSASASSNKTELDKSPASATGDEKLPEPVSAYGAVGFGTAADEFKNIVKAALFANQANGVMNDKDSIVSALYNIRLVDRLGLATFQSLTKDKLVIGKKDNIKLEVATSTMARSDQSEGLLMHAAVIGDYMVVLTDNQVTGHNRYKAYAFMLNKGAAAMNAVHINSFKAFLMKVVKAVKAVKDKYVGMSAEKIADSLIGPISPTYIMDSDNVHTKIRAIRIAGELTDPKTKKILNDALGVLNAHAGKQPKIAQQAQAPAQSKAQIVLKGSVTNPAGTIVYNIKRLDDLFLGHTLNPEYEWKNDATSDKLAKPNVPVHNYNWHGDRSLQRIVAQYAMNVDKAFTTAPKKPKKFVLFSTETNDKKYTTADLLEMYNEVNTKKKKVKLHGKNASLYYTCLFVTALRDQNFGALFTSQPNFSTKPVNDDKPSEPNYDKEYNLQRPDCGKDGGNSPIEDVDSDEETVDLSTLNKAVSFVDGLIKAGVLSKRDTANNLLDCKGTLEQLDGMLNEIQKDDIGKYTSGGAGKSTEYEAMLGQSMKCFVMFLPLIERMVRKQYEKDAVSDDFVRSKALSYGCVSHGLDPKHIIAVRYAMIEDQKTYESHSYPLSRKICKELFELLLEEESTGPGSFPVTRELMRTRVLGAITVIEEISREPESLDFGRSYLKPKRASMFI